MQLGILISTNLYYTINGINTSFATQLTCPSIQADGCHANAGLNGDDMTSSNAELQGKTHSCPGQDSREPFTYKNSASVRKLTREVVDPDPLNLTGESPEENVRMTDRT
ncbi:hypothetical protein KC19_2G016200 [Ceratodon purpureus]|uniref:Uncharacterized protein n=1 Tax=Ceratodon purpureus TaxID=3225 RepID=A0A8T0ISW6_CERPU|nr:hypothetical protein KC19_2G016100 [Ceratodon purpureus]KAG0585495.1 hypothetical protein KC19_2G016200 [Ceratodon purpureus]